MPFTYILVYAERGSLDGTLDPVTKARCDRALEIAKSVDQPFFILAAGYSKYLARRGDTRVRTLAMSMYYYMRNRGVKHYSVNAMAPPLLMNTWTESVQASRLMNSWRDFIVVSSWYHLPRIRLCWKLIGRTPIRFIGARTPLRKLPAALLHEMIGYPYYLLKYGLLSSREEYA